jgi:Polyketide cyclase / dehydrase and lipid transport
MDVDVTTEIDIAGPRLRVARYAMDPDNATTWYRNIKSVEWKSPKPLQIGSRIAFVAQFLGRTVAYTYEIRQLIDDEYLVMATSEGPFAMETTYSFGDGPAGGTRMTLRNRGKPSGFGRIAAPMMRKAMRRANQGDLARLKEVLEDSAPH